MKVTSVRNPVRHSWLVEQGLRLDPASYLSGSYEARKLLDALPHTQRLDELTSGHGGGIFNGPKFKRHYVTESDHGVPFLGSTAILEADLSNLPRISGSIVKEIPYLRIEPGMTLISCSGTVGRTAYSRPDMVGCWSSQDVMKVRPDPSRIRPGYLYAFLGSKYGVPILAGAAYGTIIQHIEPHHIADLPVPRFAESVEREIHDLVQEAADSRAAFQEGLTTATEDLFASAGLPDLLDPHWHLQGRDIGFSVPTVDATSLRAVNFIPRAARLLDALRSVPHRTLGEICSEGTLSSGVRFKRIDTDSEHGVQLIGQRQAFWLRPEGRWISPAHAPRGIYAEDETVMVAAQGTLGENEVYCRTFMVTGTWLDYVYSQHFLRVVPGMSDYPGAYLCAFLRSEAVFRVLRSMSTGGKQQDISPVLRAKLPVPECTPHDRMRIAETVRNAYRARDEADMKEDRALELLDDAVQGAAR